MPTKPRKPRADFPLFAHANGQWAKKVRGKLHYFGAWANPDAALAEYFRIREDLQAGRTPTPVAGVVCVADVCNSYLERAEQRRDSGEISPRTFDDYYDACRLMTLHLGRTADPEQLRPADFARLRTALSKYAPSRMTKCVGITRMVIRWAHESELIDRLPRFGPDFKGASKRLARQHRKDSGQKLFTAGELRLLLAKADVTFRAMLYCAINGGMGNTDVSALPLDAVDFGTGWIDFPRPKTGIERRVPLWPETIQALRDAIDHQPEPDSVRLANRVFLTRFGNEWCPEGRRDNQVSAKFRKLLNVCNIDQGGFYWCRHTFQTIADGAKDPIATAHVMGHADGTMGGAYRETIGADRLRAVTDHVRAWLFLQPVKVRSRWAIMAHPNSYWTGDAWSTDIKAAVQFASEEEARSQITEQRAALLASPFCRD